MRKLVSLFFLTIILYSCGNTPFTSIMNYAGGTIVDKHVNGLTASCYVKVRYLDPDSIYQVEEIEVTKYEYNLFNIGETIRLKY